jgi:hypothetical protein
MTHRVHQLASVDSTERLTKPASELPASDDRIDHAAPDAHSARLRIVLVPSSGGHASIMADDASFGPAVPDPGDGDRTRRVWVGGKPRLEDEGQRQ